MAKKVSWKPKISEIKNKIEEGNRFLLAISGGVDSMVLMNFFVKTFPKETFVIAHYNHGIREESKHEQEYIENYCKEHEVKLFVGNLPSDVTSTSEESLRNYRWGFLEKIAHNEKCSHIVTGHHLDDQIENFIFRIMRGSEIDSLYMSKETSVNGFIRYKPFLDEYKESIREYADNEYNQIVYFEDSSNHENDYSRNKIRNELIPHMCEFFNIKKTIPSLIEKLKKEQNGK